MAFVDSNVFGLSLSHRLFNKTVLIVGGGEVAYTRLQKLVPTKCKIHLVSPKLHPKIIEDYGELIKSKILHTQRNFDLEDFDLNTEGNNNLNVITPDLFESLSPEEITERCENITFDEWSLVLICIDDPGLSLKFYQYGTLKFPNVPLNICDKPKLCPVYFGAVAKIGGPNGIDCMISSNGKAPRFAALLKKDIEKRYLELDVEGSCNKIETLRNLLKKEEIVEKFKGNIIPVRMKFLIYVTDAFDLFNCQKLDCIKLEKLFIDVYINKSDELPLPKDLVQNFSI
ncbi:hypothetical protein HANVADRAFT_23121 [Hanseniaspora valbyensis NRRL Y-1626]|uniref:precorrin-2 dehydrogenase n=1 Tax=Hanseniaspora valbyensis NRRL Y-1626 TaxID=766949 RepID=A0A1B7TGH2_9ASCO|nr:hypothetical protein HANVADRAFT_23121 [Hanseniaspora valbyensis NRRL Y-1626]